MVLRAMLNMPPPPLPKRFRALKALLMLPMLLSLGAMLGVGALLALYPEEATQPPNHELVLEPLARVLARRSRPVAMSKGPRAF